MSYVITKNTKRGLQIGQTTYNSKEEALKRKEELKAQGHEVQVMELREALGL